MFKHISTIPSGRITSITSLATFMSTPEVMIERALSYSLSLASIDALSLPSADQLCEQTDNAPASNSLPVHRILKQGRRPSELNIRQASHRQSLRGEGVQVGYYGEVEIEDVLWEAWGKK